MRYTGKDADNQEIASLRRALEPVFSGLKFSLVELGISKQKGSVQVRAVIYNGGSIGTDDCSKVHRAITPRLELIFEGSDIYLEVSSPGINRLIKDGAEFNHYLGKKVRCYRTDISDWSEGILESVDEKGIVIMDTIKNEAIKLGFEIIAKAKLDASNN